jgi:acetyl-CoA carboxylase biotin carboxyl carrier protein
MRISDIAEIASWLSAAGLATCELTGPDYRICLRRGVQAPSTATGLVDSGFEAATQDNESRDLVTSPSVGLFLHAHPVHETRLVEPNEPVSAGQPIGLLQIGPILLPVVSPHDGIVASIIAPDGSLVGYGDPLVALSS